MFDNTGNETSFILQHLNIIVFGSSTIDIIRYQGNVPARKDF